MSETVSILSPKQRLDICLDCDRLFELIPHAPQCKECGCFMKVKTRLKSSSCPLGKW
jgi:predicted Zn-ribbon and HTH transcriptional regulator